MLSEETLKNLATSCRLYLTPQEIAQYQQDLDALESLAAPLLEVHFSHGEDGTAEVPLSALRDDQVEQMFSRDVMLNVAPKKEKGYILVPRAVEDSK